MIELPVSEFTVPYSSKQIDTFLACDIYGDKETCSTLILHGGGKGTRERFLPLRSALLEAGHSTLAIDFVGHGKTGGDLNKSSLASRTEQSLTLLESLKDLPIRCILGTSMGAYNAIKLSCKYKISTLVLMVPAVYTSKAYNLPFDSEFTKIISEPRSWDESDAWNIISDFRGHIFIVGAGKDEVIPAEIPARLYDCAVKAKKREIYWIPDSSHTFINYLNADTSSMKTVTDKITSFL